MRVNARSMIGSCGSTVPRGSSPEDLGRRVASAHRLFGRDRRTGRKPRGRPHGSLRLARHFGGQADGCGPARPSPRPAISAMTPKAVGDVDAPHGNEPSASTPAARTGPDLAGNPDPLGGRSVPAWAHLVLVVREGLVCAAGGAGAMRPGDHVRLLAPQARVRPPPSRPEASERASGGRARRCDPGRPSVSLHHARCCAGARPHHGLQLRPNRIGASRRSHGFEAPCQAAKSRRPLTEADVGASHPLVLRHCSVSRRSSDSHARRHPGAARLRRRTGPAFACRRRKSMPRRPGHRGGSMACLPVPRRASGF